MEKLLPTDNLVTLSLPNSVEDYVDALSTVTRLLETREDLEYWGERECLIWELFTAFAYKDINVPKEVRLEERDCIQERREEYQSLIKEGN
tara:strand:+ start:137 stop:409 length:273 start_codon:yes stop_codon:yes gene_type:complete